MNQIYLSSRWEEETFQDLSHAEPEEDHEVAPITPKLISSNQSYPHIYDVKLQTRQLSTDELSNLLNLKSKIYSEEWSKICEDDFDSGSDDEGQPQIKSKYWRVSTNQNNIFSIFILIKDWADRLSPRRCSYRTQPSAG